MSDPEMMYLSKIGFRIRDDIAFREEIHLVDGSVYCIDDADVARFGFERALINQVIKRFPVDKNRTKGIVWCE